MTFLPVERSSDNKTTIKFRVIPKNKRFPVFIDVIKEGEIAYGVMQDGNLYQLGDVGGAILLEYDKREVIFKI